MLKNSLKRWILFISFGNIMSAGTTLAAELVYDPHGKRDPFVPLVTTQSKESSGLLGVEQIEEVNVEGIVYDKKNGSVVILNGSVLKEGEEMGSVKVLGIKPDGVLLSLNGVEGFKTLYQEEKKNKISEK